MNNQSQKTLPQNKLRDIAWGIGANYPIALANDQVSLAMVNPHQAFIHWHINQTSINKLHEHYQDRFNGSCFIIRVYDITDIIFDGLNAHSFFDINIHGLSGIHYARSNRPGRNYMAEIGFRLTDGSFHALERSSPTYFSPTKASGHYNINGFFISPAIKKHIPVENIFNAKIFEQLNQRLQESSRTKPLSVAYVYLNLSVDTQSDTPLNSFINQLCQKMQQMGIKEKFFSPLVKANENNMPFVFQDIDSMSRRTFRKIAASHKMYPFALIHCHDWYSSLVGTMAKKILRLPLIITIYSTEYERSHAKSSPELSTTIERWESRFASHADCVIVPKSTTQESLINRYGIQPEKIVIIPTTCKDEAGTAFLNPTEIKRSFGLQQEAQVVLFSAEISHAAGADLLMESLLVVSRNHHNAHFIFAGDGPLKGELERLAWQAGVGYQCHFFGDVNKETFDKLLIIADFVVIPARTWADENLARLAIANGKPVLTTHQAHMTCVVHGENGLIAFDNSNSLIWGLNELLSSPLKGSMLRLIGRKPSGQDPTLETIAASYYIAYETCLKNLREVNHG